MKKKSIKGWAIVSRGGVLIGGGTKHFGYTPLDVYSTRLAAKSHFHTTRPNDLIVPITITYQLHNPKKKKR